jgi:hypothetical protein
MWLEFFMWDQFFRAPMDIHGWNVESTPIPQCCGYPNPQTREWKYEPNLPLTYPNPRISAPNPIHCHPRHDEPNVALRFVSAYCKRGAPGFRFGWNLGPWHRCDLGSLTKIVLLEFNMSCCYCKKSHCQWVKCRFHFHKISYGPPKLLRSLMPH